jgi:hypothetical protein
MLMGVSEKREENCVGEIEGESFGEPVFFDKCSYFYSLVPSTRRRLFCFLFHTLNSQWTRELSFL